MSLRMAPVSATVGRAWEKMPPEGAVEESKIAQSDGFSDPTERMHGTPKSFPPLSSLIETGLDGAPASVRRGVNVSSLLDFAVLGFPKCGTTTLMQSLDTPADAAVVQNERCGLGNDNVAKLVYQLVEGDSLPRDPTVKRGIKCPKDLESASALRNLAKYFPRTKLIVTVRHPVLWFQSFYNFRVKNTFSVRRQVMPPTKRMIGGQAICRRAQNVCTDRAKFHTYLAHMAKTPLSSLEEMELLQPGWNKNEIVRITAKLFLMDVSQLGDKNQTRLDKFREDLRSFTGLEGEVRIESAKIVAEEVIPQKIRKQMIDICSSENNLVRQVLMKHARKASKWIISYLLKSPDVVVSSRDHFIELIRLWEYDPCEQVSSSGGMRRASNTTQ